MIHGYVQPVSVCVIYLLTRISNKLRLECSDGSLLAMVFGDVPDHLRSSLLEKLEVVFTSNEYSLLREVDTSMKERP